MSGEGAEPRLAAAGAGAGAAAGAGANVPALVPEHDLDLQTAILQSCEPAKDPRGGDEPPPNKKPKTGDNAEATVTCEISGCNEEFPILLDEDATIVKPVIRPLTSNVPELPDTIGELKKLEILWLSACSSLIGMWELGTI